MSSYLENSDDILYAFLQQATELDQEERPVIDLLVESVVDNLIEKVDGNRRK